MAGSQSIFIVEDDPTIRTLLEMALSGAGYANVASYARGDEALAAARSNPPDLVLLDVMMPGLDGFAFARAVRASPALAAVRIIMITARSEGEDVVRGLESGADDYVTKPFDRRILLARIAAVLRRSLPVAEGMDFGGLKIFEAARRVELDGRQVRLAPGEFDMLYRLVSRRGCIVARSGDQRTVDVQIANLRRKLEPWSRRIETIRGIGYRVNL